MSSFNFCKNGELFKSSFQEVHDMEIDFPREDLSESKKRKRKSIIANEDGGKRKLMVILILNNWKRNT